VPEELLHPSEPLVPLELDDVSVLDPLMTKIPPLTPLVEPLDELEFQPELPLVPVLELTPLVTD